MPSRSQALEAALVDELAPEGALQVVLARRVAVAAWRLARADRMEVELFEERRWEDAGVGMALIRDGNGTRSFETLLRYRGAAMAEFWRALKTLKALQAEQAAGADLALEQHATPLAPRPAAANRPQPNEPCLAGMWHGGGAPTPYTGWARGVGDRNEPRVTEPVAQHDPAPRFF